MSILKSDNAGSGGTQRGWPCVLSSNAEALIQRRCRHNKISGSTLLTGFGGAGTEGVTKPPMSVTPKAEAIEVEVNDGRRVQRQQLAEDQSADDRDAERPTKFGSLAEADHQWHRADPGRRQSGKGL